ncbi:fibronectin type III domain-containing protein, partial [Pseudobacteroides cellulosolvens]
MKKNIRNLLVYLLVFILTFQQVIQVFAATNLQGVGTIATAGIDTGDVYEAIPTSNEVLPDTPTPVPIVTPTSTLEVTQTSITMPASSTPKVSDVTILPAYTQFQPSNTPDQSNNNPTDIVSQTPMPTILNSSTPTGVFTANPSIGATPTLTSKETPIPEGTLVPTQTPDVKVLPKPEGVSLIVIDNSSVKLSWDGVKNDTEVKGYEIYRNGIKIGTADVAEYTDTGLSAGTSYNYFVKACGASDNVSEASEGLLLVLGTTTISSDISLSENRVYQNINFTSGTLDLKRHSIYVYGSLNQTGGTMYIDGGKLEVSGNYTIKNPSYYTYAYLKMTNETDYVKIGGSFTQHSYYSHEGNLTAGTIEVKGDFIQETQNGYYADPSNFKASGTHKVILTGTSQQKISFDNPAQSCF